MQKSIRVLALDLEGTLISNAMSQIPRPGLYEFLDEVKRLVPRVVIFTTIGEERFRGIANLLAAENKVPMWFSEIEYVTWTGATKDLSFIRGAQTEEALLVDDFKEYIHPGQEDRWVPIRCFDRPYAEDDNGLYEVILDLRKRLAC